MQLLHIAPQQVTQLPELPAATAADGFYWLDLTQEELAADEARWLEAIAALTGARLFDLHLRDALNAQQPSFFDRMRDYDVLVFRRLAPSEAPPLAEVDGARRRPPRGLRPHARGRPLFPAPVPSPFVCICLGRAQGRRPAPQPN
ncbi:MAG: hypothetical protein RMK97_10245 [Sutterellaceae bacterium]|nr:hypothetical protein [Burkholderiaceae bacterium]MDW8430862.1 hypothetical protein [Sutterellaceae bacterium]